MARNLRQYIILAYFLRFYYVLQWFSKVLLEMYGFTLFSFAFHRLDSGRLWDALGCSGVLWGGPGSSGEVWDAMRSFGRPWEALGSSGWLLESLGYL